MERSLLRRLFAEIAERLLEQELHRVSTRGESHYLLRFSGPDRLNLVVSLRPDLPRVHLAPAPAGRRDVPQDAFAALLDRDLAGSRLTAVEGGHDRWARLIFTPPGGAAPASVRTLAVEMFGRRANAFLLAADDVILATAREPGGPRGLVVGSRYVEPPPVTQPGPDEDTGATPGATVLSPRPLAEYREGERPDPGHFRIAPGRDAATARDEAAQWYPTFSEAAAALYDLLERLLDFERERDRLLALARRECQRLARLDRHLAQDLERAAGADRHRRYAEALLAGLRTARISGNRVLVPDPSSAEGDTVEVPIDPSLPLQANAERHYAAWKKGKRAEAAIAERRGLTAARLAQWTAIETRVQAGATGADLEAVREAMAHLGLVHAAPRRARAARAVSPPAPARVRRHVTRDGFVILVGRSGAENDSLTFKVAGPEDFWLHAAGVAGAHVVVRNPGRIGVLPDAALRIAGQIAAWYSDARADAHVEVHYTQRKHVRKRRGAPPGQVLLKKFRSIRVEPRLPERAFEEP